MSHTDFSSLTISEASRLLHDRQISAVELTRDALARVDATDAGLHAFLRTTPDLALMFAEKADQRLESGEGTALTGIPMGVKDILSVAGTVTTCGSRILENYMPQYTATAVQRLLDAGAVPIGKTNMDEFAMGSSNENSAFGPACNPWDTSRVPGGSSGGSAVAVSAGDVIFALGTDTGGSVRQPAALTGTVGLKPSYGRVSRFGLVAFGSSLDQVGPLTRSVEDAAIVLGTMAGPDSLDSTSLPDPVPDYLASLHRGVSGMRLGVPREYFGEGMSAGVRAAMDAALDTLRDLGAELVDVSLPMTEHSLSTYYIIAPAEAMANLARFDGVRYGLSVRGTDVWEMFAQTRDAGFGAEVKRRILLGSYVLSAGYYDAYYVKALKVRTLVRREFEAVFATVDAIVAPTSPTVAFRLGERTDDPLQMYLSDVYTVPANIAGICGISIPAGFDGGLPIGLQILGPSLGEATILQVAHAFEQATEFHLAHPPLASASVGGEI